MSLQIQATGHYLIYVIKPDNSIKESIEFSNLITDIGLKDWLTHGIGDQLKIGIGQYNDNISKTMESLPEGFTNIDLVNIKNDEILTETDSHLIYRYLYERTCPNETSDVTYNTLATVFPTTNHLFSIAKIRNMDNGVIDLIVKENEQVKIQYELRLTIVKSIYSKPNTDIGFSGLTDVNISIERGSQLKGGLTHFTTTLKDTAQTENDDGVEVVLERTELILEPLVDRLRFNIEEKLKYKQHQRELTNIKSFDRDLGLFRVVTTLSPAIDRTQTTLDITMNCSLDVVKGGI